jgi:hypothetical protein
MLHVSLRHVYFCLEYHVVLPKTEAELFLVPYPSSTNAFVYLVPVRLSSFQFNSLRQYGCEWFITHMAVLARTSRNLSDWPTALSRLACPLNDRICVEHVPRIETRNGLWLDIFVGKTPIGKPAEKIILNLFLET